MYTIKGKNTIKGNIKHPPVRLYFKPKKDTYEIYVFEFEMKTSEETQQKTIQKLKQKAGKL